MIESKGYKNSFKKLTFEIRAIERGKIVEKVTLLDTVELKKYMNKYQ